MKPLRICCLLGGLPSLILVVLGCDPKRPPVAETPPPLVMVATPVLRKVTDHMVFTARTAAEKSVEIKPRVTGFLKRIAMAKDGGLVKATDILFEIDDRPYKNDLDNAKATLAFCEASLEKSEADYKIGLDVQKQNPGAISEQELIKRKGSRDEARANVGKATAALAQADLNYGWCKVTAEIDGRANRHFVDEGNIVTKDVTTLTNVVSLKPVWAYFDVDENSALRYQAKVAAGEVPSFEKASIPVQLVLPGREKHPIAGKTDFVSNQFDPNTGSIRLRAVFANEKDGLDAGLFARIKVDSSSPHEALLVRDAAIGTIQSQRYIMVVDKDDVVRQRVVQVGQIHEEEPDLEGQSLREVYRYQTTGTDTVEVLNPGDRIIVEGLQRAREGAKVKPQPVDMVTLMPIQSK